MKVLGCSLYLDEAPMWSTDAEIEAAVGEENNNNKLAKYKKVAGMEAGKKEIKTSNKIKQCKDLSVSKYRKIYAEERSGDRIMVIDFLEPL